MSTKVKMQPALRFPGFTEDWNETPMGELLSFKNGYNAAKEQYGTGVKFINVLDIIQNDFITHDRIIGSVEIPNKDFEKNEVKYGDILFQRSSETREEVGQTNVYLDRDKSATFGGFVIRGRPLTEFDPVYFNSMLKTSKPRKDITSRSGGSTRYNIGQESLEDVLVSVAPSLPEQRKIADFLTAVDGRIQQLSQKLALLQDYKKGVMQQLFIQALRFKDDLGNEFPDWEEKRLVELCSTFRSGKGITSVAIATEGEFPVYGGNGLRGYTDTFTHDEDMFLIGRQGALCGNITRVTGKCYVSEHAVAVVTNDIANIEWLAQRIAYLNLNRFSESSAQPGLAVHKLERLKVPTPSLAEQTKIANFLTALDRKIESVAHQITHTQTFKRGLLQQMFV